LTTPVYFGGGEIINMPVHINKQNDSPDIADIFISSTGGNPTFLQPVEMGEDRTTSGGSDKYTSYMSLFHNGITFTQPNVRITDATAIQSKVNRFHDSTAAAYIFTPSLAGLPTGSAPFNDSTRRCSAVQLEFYVQGGVGYVKITNNCAVRLMDPGPSDYNIVTGSSPTSFHQYKTYGYHYKPTAVAPTVISIDSNSSPCYVSQNIGTYPSAKGGQIFINGNVIIGGDSNATLTDPNQVVKGRITVVATGNIWIADSIRAYGPVDRSLDPNGIPDVNNNTSVLGLIAQGVIKVVDPGQSPSSPSAVVGYTYQPIGVLNSGNRYLLDPTIVDAAITVGGGGWGAENTPNRRVWNGTQDFLVVHGSITEVVRGIVGHLGSDGYIKQYYSDKRLMSGILPGDIWLSGKYYPAPAGWHDNQTAD
jgi:hypothetical protein